jgi:ribA/ribD-fused uncharacterized protein
LNIFEIMTMESTQQITRFIGEHSFLANFYVSTIYVDGRSYPSVEHAYQAAKASTESERELIRAARTPMEAKKLGKSLILPPDWEEGRVELMRKLVRAKFENPLLRELLRATGAAELIQDNKWSDRFWGVFRGEGHNWLGKILMEVREEIMQNPD